MSVLSVASTDVETPVDNLTETQHRYLNLLWLSYTNKKAYYTELSDPPPTELRCTPRADLQSDLNYLLRGASDTQRQSVEALFRQTCTDVLTGYTDRPVPALDRDAGPLEKLHYHTQRELVSLLTLQVQTDMDRYPSLLPVA